MAKVPENPEEIFESYVKAWRDVFGDAVEAIAVYGSAVRGDYVPGKSDINFLVVLAEPAMTELQKAIPIVAEWRKRAVAVPLIVTRAYITSSLDSFPVEFLTLKLHHRCLYGEDPLASVEVEHSHVRLQLEREFKGKLLHLRTAMLAFAENRDALLEVLQRSLKDFVPLFEALLFLKNQPIPSARAEICRAAAALVSADPRAFDEIEKILAERKRVQRQQALALTKSYIQLIEKFSGYVDTLTT